LKAYIRETSIWLARNSVRKNVEEVDLDSAHAWVSAGVRHGGAAAGYAKTVQVNKRFIRGEQMKNRVKKQNFKTTLFLVVAALSLGAATFANGQHVRKPADGTILVMTSPDPVNNPTAPAGIVAVSPKTGAQSILSSGGLFAFPTDIREAPDDTLYVADQNAMTSGAIIAVDPSSGVQTLIASGGYLAYPQAIQTLANGHLVVASGPLSVGSNAPPNLVEIDPNTGEQTLITQGGILVFPNGLQPGPGDTVYVNDTLSGGTGAIFQLDLQTGALTLLTTGGLIFYSDAIVTDSRGNLLTYNFGDNSIVRINPKTGSQKLVATSGLIANGNGMTVNRANDIILTELQTPAGVIEVEPSGAQRTVSTGGLLDVVYAPLVFYRNQCGSPE